MTGKLRSLMYKIKGPPKAEKLEPKEEEEKAPSKFSFHINTFMMQALKFYSQQECIFSKNFIRD